MITHGRRVYLQVRSSYVVLPRGKRDVPPVVALRRPSVALGRATGPSARASAHKRVGSAAGRGKDASETAVPGSRQPDRVRKARRTWLHFGACGHHFAKQYPSIPGVRETIKAQVEI